VIQFVDIYCGIVMSSCYTMIQKHKKLKKGTSLRGFLRTPNNNLTFRFNRRGTQTHTPYQFKILNIRE
jgi:hypothetical protein